MTKIRNVIGIKPISSVGMLSYQKEDSNNKKLMKKVATKPLW